MQIRSAWLLALSTSLILTACVSKKDFLSLQSEMDVQNAEMTRCGEDLTAAVNRYDVCVAEQKSLHDKLKQQQNISNQKSDQVRELKEQINDLRVQRDIHIRQISDLTDLSQSSSNNINKTLSQLQNKEKHLNLLRATKTKHDSLNLALAINLKSVLNQGIDEQDVEVKIDKTVVFINLSDKMVFESGSSKLTPRASEVLGKIAKIVEDRPELEVMVEGYTDSLSIKSSCIEDNWDLSVKRATAVVRTLQTEFLVDPNRLIAAGRGEYNVLASNKTEEGRAINRRTRIIILPKVDQFYDLLDPDRERK